MLSDKKEEIARPIVLLVLFIAAIITHSPFFWAWRFETFPRYCGLSVCFIDLVSLASLLGFMVVVLLTTPGIFEEENGGEKQE